MTRTVHVVPHTHWDREWYKPFQTFRMRLVELVDGLLPLLERDPTYAHFMLDGQMAVVDDYLAVRPEQHDRIRALAASGRLSVGPWYILMDEFLVSAETIVRDLELGLSRAAAFGGAMPVGYLPDMFGHIAQMPQILRQFGFEHAVVWRGTPASMAEHPAFRWVAPDGSSVQARYLPRGYGNGAHLPDDAKDLVAQVQRYAEELGARAGADDEPVLWMHGTDHLHPQARLGQLVAEANDIQDDWRFEVGSLAAYVASADRPDLPAWQGELRSGARANLLMGVASNRVDVKQAAARAERGLERLAEPLSALYLPPGRWPKAFLDEAWKLVIVNSAHDSICACSIDEVVDAVLHRFAEAVDLADGLTERALLGVSLAVATLDSGSRNAPAPLAEGVAPPLAVNASPRTRSGLVTFTLPPDVPVDGAQVLSTTPDSVRISTVSPAEALAFVDVVVDNFGDVHRIDIDERDDGTLDARLRVDPRRFGLLDPAPARARFERLAAEAPGATVRVWMDFTPQRQLLAHVADVPGFGWARWVPGRPDVEPVVAEGRVLRNGLLTVEVADDGTFSVDGHAGLGRLVDGGDKGDTYNWCPPADDVVVATPERVEVHVVESGPLRAALAVDATYRWPERVLGEARVGAVEVGVRTTLELRAGEDIVRVEVSFDNWVRDHRLRAVFALPEPATSSRAECAFAVVERGLTAEGGLTESPMTTFPSRRFVSAGGLTLAHEGLLEYELVDVADGRASALALTLVRATGLLSQVPMATRPLPAGPITPMEGPQMQQRVSCRYALHLGDRNPYAVVDDAFLPLLGVGGIEPAPPGQVAVDHTSDPTRAADLRHAVVSEDGRRGSPLTIEGAEVSAVRRVAGDVLEVRVFNPTAETVAVRVDGRRGWTVDLRGRPQGPFSGSVELGPWAVQTLHLSD